MSVRMEAIRPETSFVEKTFGKKPKEILDKVWTVAKEILKGALAIAFFVTNPNIFAGGFLIGVVWEDKVQHVIDKIEAIWKTQPWQMLVLGGIAAFFALPVTWAAGSFLTSAYIGCKMSQKAKEQLYTKDEKPQTNDAGAGG